MLLLWVTKTFSQLINAFRPKFYGEKKLYSIVLENVIFHYNYLCITKSPIVSTDTVVEQILSIHSTYTNINLLSMRIYV